MHRQETTYSYYNTLGGPNIMDIFSLSIFFFYFKTRDLLNLVKD